MQEIYTRCFPCKTHREATGHGVADVLVPIALAVKGEQLAHELWRYKNAPQESIRQRLTVQLAAVLWRFLAAHEACVARACGIESFRLVTVVPSGSRRPGTHPLAQIVGSLVGHTRDRFADLLVAQPIVLNDRVLRDDRYEARRFLAGQPVLLIDDTWTTGAHAQSAVSALRAAGAPAVGVVVIGRHFTRGFAEHDAYYIRAKRRPFSWDTCCLDVVPPG